MEKKFDTYYVEEIVYKMSYSELVETLNGNIRNLNERNLLAYIRGCEGNFKFLSPINYDSKEKILHCQIDDPNYPKDIYNPLYEKDILYDGHWFHAYKIVITDLETKTKRESLYFSDMVSLFKSGIFEIVE